METNQTDTGGEPVIIQGVISTSTNDDAIRQRWKLNKEIFENARKDPEELKKYPNKITQFYEQQNEQVERLLDMETLQVEGKYGADDQEANSKKARFAINLSFVVNISLFIMKVYAAISSGSLSVIASALDSFLDLLSGSIIFITNYLINRKNPYLYPAGKGRLEPIGIIIFSACMFTATLQLITQSVEILISRNHHLNITPVTIAIIACTVLFKFSLYFLCKSVKDSPSVEALAQDHRNDVVSNTLGVTAALIGYYFLWWVDGVGGIGIGLYIMFNWFRTGYGHVIRLSGKTANPAFLQQLTYLAWNHDARILQIDTVRAFHLGNGFLVEVDIVLPPEMKLREAHDIGESLQMKLEKVKDVERAFVHLDWNAQHNPEH